MGAPKYQVQKQIEKGGMAEVFKATSQSTHGYQKQVAIKRVLPSLAENKRFIRMFLDEAKLSLHLNHPNVVQVFDLGKAGETYFIVMEFIDGIDLKEMVATLRDRETHLDAHEIAFIGLEVSKGLHHAHQTTDEEGNALHVVHRDVSPPNVLVSKEGEVKITDFGIAKARSRVEETGPGMVKGKFSYLSPEAAEGQGVDRRSDIFSLGAVLWELIAEKKLFDGETDIEVLEQVKHAQIPSFDSIGRDVPTGLKNIVEKALQKNPEERFQTARKMGDKLSKFLFEFGEPVSNFQLADRVEELDQPSDSSPDAMDEFAQNMVERELKEFVSLEQLGELDKVLAERFEAEETDSTPSHHDGEDPRHWWQNRNGSDSNPTTNVSASGKDRWEEGQLSDLIKQSDLELSQSHQMSGNDQSRVTSPDKTPRPSEEGPSIEPVEEIEKQDLATKAPSNEAVAREPTRTDIWKKVLIFFGLASVALMLLVMVIAFIRIS